MLRHLSYLVQNLFKSKTQLGIALALLTILSFKSQLSMISLKVSVKVMWPQFQPIRTLENLKFCETPSLLFHKELNQTNFQTWKFFFQQVPEYIFNIYLSVSFN